jgi:L-cysteine S-thiosulfotransferase
MTMKTLLKNKPRLAIIGAALVAVGCATVPAPIDYTTAVADMLKTSFRDQGQAEVARLKQDAANDQCSASEATGKDIDAKAGKIIEETNLKTVKWPTDGKFLGDWKLGETIAQSGRGATWSDAKDAANGGNCYNCHQISKQELSFGTIGPSLYNYGKLRGVTDPASAAAKPILDYTWGKIHNAKAYNACSGMPRFGNLLTEAQIQHIMALLLDPKSPVNQ